jgi:hypothetical protein
MYDLTKLKIAKKTAPYNTAASGLWEDLEVTFGAFSFAPGSNARGSGAITTGGRVTSFSSFTFASSIVVSNPLPLALIEFQAKAQGEQAQITWIALDEKPDEHYLLERSANGTDFIAVDTIAAYGTSGLHEYTYLDAPPLTESLTWYYRLRYTTLNGEPSLTAIKVVHFEEIWLSNDTELRIYPNPIVTDGSFSVYWLSQKAEQVHYRILTLEGKLIQHGILNSKKGSNEHHIQMSAFLASGIYHITLLHSDGSISHGKLVRQ